MIAQKQFFNSMAHRWDVFCHHDLEKINYILNLLNIQEGAKILDVGTGTGILIPYLIDRAGERGEITAVDFSEKMIEIAQQKNKYDNVTFICEDVLEVDLPNNYYDFTICYSVFPHFRKKKSAIRTIGTYLKDGGRFVICHSQSREKINSVHKRVSGAVADDYLPEMSAINEYFKELNFKPIIEIDNDELFVIVAKKMPC